MTNNNIVDTSVLQCFVHPYCVVPSNVPFVIQRNVHVCEPSDSRYVSLQNYTTAVGRSFLWRTRTPNVFVRCHSISKSSSAEPNRGFPDPWGFETRFWGVRNANFECEFVHSWM